MLSAKSSGPICEGLDVRIVRTLKFGGIFEKNLHEVKKIWKMIE